MIGELLIELPLAREAGGSRGWGIALLALTTLAALVFMVAGPAAFTAVTSVGVGLFATWRTRPPRR
ncbi:hypothetical protein [Streptomyces sp. NPDC087437]|uniref:hypothetical protein n=1 Tax=Streptomyces sp. NPDC087437 TaxID=3365789 RepID=UPI0037F73487